MYAAIVFTLGNRGTVGEDSEKDKRADKVRNQVARMLVVNGIIFFLLHLPVSTVDTGKQKHTNLYTHTYTYITHTPQHPQHSNTHPLNTHPLRSLPMRNVE